MATTTREVVTFQVGHYANFIGTHWWNLQEASFVYDPSEASLPKEIDHDVMFREGQTLKGDITYTPRLVAIDLKGSLNSLKADGTLYDLREQEEDVRWNSDVTLHQSGSQPKNEFLKELEREQELVEGRVPTTEEEDKEHPERDTEESPEASVHLGQKTYNLDETIQVWSDFLHTHLHPRSLQIIRDFQHQDEQRKFDVFGLGEQLLQQRMLREELEDKMHFFFEECDNLQGIHMLVDVEDAFGSLGAGLLEQIQDDYANKTLLVFAAHPCQNGDQSARASIHRLLNTALSYDRLSQMASGFLPLSMNNSIGLKPGPPRAYPLVKYKAELAYHSSAILGASLETLTVPYRMCSPTRAHMADMMHPLTAQGKKLLGLQMALPFRLGPKESLVSSLMSLGDAAPWCPFSPYSTPSVAPYSQCVVLRGIAPSRDSRASADRHGPRGTTGTPREVIDTYMSDMYPHSQNMGFTIQSPTQIKVPYPDIFSSPVNRFGNLATQHRGVAGVELISTLSTLQSTPSSGSLLRDLHAQLKRVDIRKHHAFLEMGMEEDDYREVQANLIALADQYEITPDLEQS